MAKAGVREKPVPSSSDRLWLSAFLAWMAMLGTVAVAFGWSQWHGTLGDPDVKSVWEAVMIPLIFLTIPLALLAFGAFLPLTYLVRRFTGGRTGRFANTVIGLLLTAPVGVLFVLGSRFTPGRRPSTLAEDIAAIGNHPERVIPVVVVLAIGGLVFGATLPARTPRTAVPK
jgi:hypothetical protein